MTCRLIPVIDVKGGVVVRAVGGRRDEYRPLVSRLTDSTEPLEVARALVQKVCPRELYVADLDAIGGRGANFELYRGLSALGCGLWIDAGVRQTADAAAIAFAGTSGIICGLETLAGPEALREIVASTGRKAIFSLDLKGGKMLGDWAAWSADGPCDVWAVIQEVVEIGVQRMIVLDLAQVGEGRGVGTLELCREVRARFPRVQLFAGGGVGRPEDLHNLAAAGVTGALVASALHDGRLPGGAGRDAGIGIRL